MCSISTRWFLLVGGALGVGVACNVYTDDLITGTGGRLSVTGGTGGERQETGGVRHTGGVGPRSGGSGGTDNEGGEPTGGREETGGERETGGTTSSGGGGRTGGTGGTIVTGGIGGIDGGAGGASDGGVGGGSTLGGTGGDGGSTTGGADTGGQPVTGGSAPTTGGDGGIGPLVYATIDALEDDNDTIELEDGEGYWYTFNDGAAGGTISPDTSAGGDQLLPVALPSSPDGVSLLGIHVVANAGYTVWGAGLGCDLNAPSSAVKEKYDVSAFSGIALWALSGSGPVTLRLKVLTAEVVGVDKPGGECTEGSSECDNAYGFELAITDEWQEFHVPFGSLAQQRGWGYEPEGGFNPQSVLSIQIQADDAEAFDVWFDEFRFYAPQ